MTKNQIFSQVCEAIHPTEMSQTSALEFLEALVEDLESLIESIKLDIENPLEEDEG